jgi:hypothetical protein
VSAAPPSWGRHPQTFTLEVALEMKIARKRLLKSSLLIVSQAAINAGFVGFFLLSVAQSVSPWASHAIHE